MFKSLFRRNIKQKLALKYKKAIGFFPDASNCTTCKHYAPITNQFECREIYIHTTEEHIANQILGEYASYLVDYQMPVMMPHGLSPHKITLSTQKAVISLWQSRKFGRLLPLQHQVPCWFRPHGMRITSLDSYSLLLIRSTDCYSHNTFYHWLLVVSFFYLLRSVS